MKARTDGPQRSRETDDIHANRRGYGHGHGQTDVVYSGKTIIFVLLYTL